jgi:peroxiredoxin
VERALSSEILKIGQAMPSFSLIATNDETVTDTYFSSARASLVIFSCNHCPYVKGSEDDLLEVFCKYVTKGLMAVMINSNDATKYPDDSFAMMKNKDLPFPYLYDETQEVAKRFDAACTPECFLFDSEKRLVFHGTISDNLRDLSKKSVNYLDTAVNQLIQGSIVNPSFVHPIGCSIKWR